MCWTISFELDNNMVYNGNTTEFHLILKCYSTNTEQSEEIRF